MKTGKPAATARVLQHLPLVLLLLPWSLGGLLTPALAQADCNTAEEVLEEGEQRTIYNKTVVGLQKDQPLFVKRESSFEGFSVNVLGTDGTEHTAWFSAEEECFPNMTAWYQLRAFVEIKTENSTIEFGFEAGSCKRTCERDNAPQSLQSLSVVAYGASRWNSINFPTKGCPLELQAASLEPHKLPTCNKPEAPTSTGLSAGEIIGVLIGILVVGAVVFFMKK